MSLDPLPQSQPITTYKNTPLYMDGGWLRWFYNNVYALLGLTANRVPSRVKLTGQHAAIGATPLQLGGTSAPFVRVSWYIRVTTKDPVSSAVQVTIGWTENGTAQSVNGQNLTGNSTTTLETGTAFVQIDANSSPTYSTSYSSNTPGTMQYLLDVQVEALP